VPRPSLSSHRSGEYKQDACFCKGTEIGRRRNTDRSAATRAALIGAGRELFGERGYARVGTSELVTRAGVTRGALYHHFHDKPALFRAVFEDVQRELTERVSNAGQRDAAPLERLHAAVDEFLDACAEPAYCRIALLDAPALLGWADLHEIDDRFALGRLRDLMTEALNVDQVEPPSVEVLAHILMGAVTECGMFIARAPDHEEARKRTGKGLHQLLAALLSRPMAASVS
jgi:AcrR family transcriptional regulator